MITSRNGWVEVPYVDAPAGVVELAAGARQITLMNGATVTFLPGMRDPAAEPFSDVMRGEENPDRRLQPGSGSHGCTAGYG